MATNSNPNLNSKSNPNSNPNPNLIKYKNKTFLEKQNNVIFWASVQIPNCTHTEFEVKNSLVLFFFDSNKKFMSYNRGIAKTVTL